MKVFVALLLTSFFARSLTIVPRSLLLNRTETLATQASNKVVIGLRVVQFWSQIILVISDRTRAEITRMILTKLHSTQFNYIINAFLSLFRVSRVLLDL